jgi:hypothetical protein
MFKTLWEKIGEYNWKPKKTNPTTSEMCVPKLKHDQIQAWWISNILSKNNLLKIVWWCKYSTIKFWNQTICYMMSCLNKRKNIWVENERRSHATFEMSLKRESVIVNLC